MADFENNNSEHEAMIIPKGARILSPDGGEIQLDVQGDLVLQESQKGLTELKSHHGSILIDDGVNVKSRNIAAKHMIRVRGKLESDDIRSENISIEGGSVTCSELHTQTLESENGHIESSGISADNISIKGGSVEIGSINAKTLNMKNKVHGSVLISNAKERNVDDTVQIKGGFESDVELLGYLLKYRRQVMSDKVLQELNERKEGREFRRFLLDEHMEEDDSEPEPLSTVAPVEEEEEEAEEVVIETTAEPVVIEEEEVEEDDDEAVIIDEIDEEDDEDIVDLSDEDTAERLKEFGTSLDEALPDEAELPAILKLVRASLQQGDLKTLQALYQRWAGTLNEEAAQFEGSVGDIIEEVRLFVNERS